LFEENKDMNRPVVLASDHAGFRVKEMAKEILHELGIPTEDFGPDSDASVDYPDYARPAVTSIVEGKADRGVLVCGSGVGMSIVANKFPGIRAALVSDAETAEMSRKHNNANVLVLPGWKLQRQDTEKILKVWTETEFEGGRHQRRLDKIKAIEEKAKQNDPQDR
jgi:ribose 5-phosphate isomerase B